MEDIAAQRAAETLLAEHKANTIFKRFGPQQSPATVSDAYDIQQKFVRLLRSEHGDTIGYKVGLTSATMQKFCGIGHPIAGVVLAKRAHRSGAIVRRSEFGRLGLEFEIAVRIASDVPATDMPYTAEMIGPHIGGVGAAIELVDDRGADYTRSRRPCAGCRQLLEWGHRAFRSGAEMAGPGRCAGYGDERQCCDRRRTRSRYSRSSLQFSGMARHPPRRQR